MQLRRRTMAVLAAVACLLIGGAAGASTLSMVWIATSGAGSGVGTSTLTGVPVGSSAVLEIRVTVTSSTTGIEGLGVFFNHDLDIVVATANAPCPPTPNNEFSPSCGRFENAIGPGISGFLGSALSLTNELGNWFDAATGQVLLANPGSGQANGAFFEMAHLTFSAVGPGTTGGVLFGPFGGQLDIDGPFHPTVPATGATISVIPEPGTFLLVALGLGGMAVAARRRF